MAERFYREPGQPVVALADVLDLLEKRAQIEAPNAAAALRWTAKLALQKWGADAQAGASEVAPTACPSCGAPTWDGRHRNGHPECVIAEVEVAP